MDGSALSGQEKGAGADAGKQTAAPDAVDGLPPVPTREELIAKVRAYHPRVKSELLGQAYDFAKKHHGVQTRASGEA